MNRVRNTVSKTKLKIFFVIVALLVSFYLLLYVMYIYSLYKDDSETYYKRLWIDTKDTSKISDISFQGDSNIISLQTDSGSIGPFLNIDSTFTNFVSKGDSVFKEQGEFITFCKPSNMCYIYHVDKKLYLRFVKGYSKK